MDIKIKVGYRLRELRTQKKLSQEKFALQCGLDRSYIAGVEQGRRNISIVNIEKISRALHLSVADFFNTKAFAND